MQFIKVLGLVVIASMLSVATIGSSMQERRSLKKMAARQQRMAQKIRSDGGSVAKKKSKKNRTLVKTRKTLYRPILGVFKTILACGCVLMAVAGVLLIGFAIGYAAFINLIFHGVFLPGGPTSLFFPLLLLFGIPSVVSYGFGYSAYYDFVGYEADCFEYREVGMEVTVV